MFIDGTSRFSSTNNDMDSVVESEVTRADPLDDVFGGDSDDDHITSNSLHHQQSESRSRNEDVSDVPRLQSIHTTNGYREGIAASKEKFLQEGFDEGYSLGAEFGAAAGRLIGVLEAVVTAKKASTDAEDDVASQLAKAKVELSAKSLYAPEFFGEDGIWKFAVDAGDQGEENITFRMVARNHPMLKQWSTTVADIVKSSGLTLNSA